MSTRIPNILKIRLFLENANINIWRKFQTITFIYFRILIINLIKDLCWPVVYIKFNCNTITFLTLIKFFNLTQFIRPITLQRFLTTVSVSFVRPVCMFNNGYCTMKYLQRMLKILLNFENDNRTYFTLQ